MKQHKFKRISIKIVNREKNLAFVNEGSNLEKITFFAETDFARLRRMVEFYVKKRNLVDEEEHEKLSEIFHS